jgi:hypothetical protein
MTQGADFGNSRVASKCYICMLKSLDTTVDLSMDQEQLKYLSKMSIYIDKHMFITWFSGSAASAVCIQFSYVDLSKIFSRTNYDAWLASLHCFTIAVCKCILAIVHHRYIIVRLTVRVGVIHYLKPNCNKCNKILFKK